MGKSRNYMCPFSYWSVVNVIKVRRQKDICKGKRQKDMCLAIGEQEREIPNSSKSGERKKSDL